MGCLKLLNNSKLFANENGTKYQPLAVAYKREWLLDESINDAHGNMLSMPHLSLMQWDFADRLKSASNGTFTSYYNYDSSGERSRKVVDKGYIREERYYIGGYEVYRKYVNNSLDTERITLHVMDDTKTVALIETDTLQSTVTVRYQYDNHLGSACLELNENAGIISYEEYHPFGTTSYRSGRTETEVSLKRYKYVGKERDEETGLYYYGARYYAAWLCRFVSVDPLQHEYPDLTPFQYASNSPVSYIDLDGLEKGNTAFNINDMLNQAAKRFAPVQDNIKPNTPSTVKKMEVEAQKAEKAKKKEEYQNSTQYKENAHAIAKASAQARGISIPETNIMQQTNASNTFFPPGGPKYNIPNTTPDIIYKTPTEYEKFLNLAIAPETKNMVMFDPVFKGVSSGAAAYMSLPAFKLSTFSATSITSGVGDFAAQMTFKQDIYEWNVTQTFATMLFKYSFTQALVGSAGEIRLKNILGKDNGLINHSIFGEKSFSQLGIETSIGTFFNHAGNQSIKGLGISNSFGKATAETSLFHLNYTISTSVTNTVNNEFNK